MYKHTIAHAQLAVAGTSATIQNAFYERQIYRLPSVCDVIRCQQLHTHSACARACARLCMFMYVNVCVYTRKKILCCIYESAREYNYSSMCLCGWVCTSTSVCECTCVCLCVCVYVCVCVCVHVCLCVHVCVCVLARATIYSVIYTRVQIPMCTNIVARVCV
jgi:hypothetical protein